MKRNVPHESHKVLSSDFNRIWQRLAESGEQYLVTPRGHKFTAEAIMGLRGTHENQKLIRIKQDNIEFARIYSCCWRHTTNCHGTHIGGYSDGLDSWYRGLMISVDSLILKPKAEVIKDFNSLLNSSELNYKNAVSYMPPDPGVYLIYDKKQRKYIYAGGADNIRKRLRQHAHKVGDSARFNHQQIQKGLINSGRCKSSVEARDYISSNCTLKYLKITDEKTRKYPWKRRTILEHYAISVIEPEYNISTGS
jgi:predicted GIY-YIG superfamily endonuclease